MSKPKTIKSLRAGVVLEDGNTVFLKRGDEVPADATKESLERLERNGAFIGPEEAEAALAAESIVPGDEAPGASPALADAEPEALREFVREHSAKDVVAAAGDNADLAKRLLEAEQAEKNRKTAVEPLEELANPTDSGQADDPNTPPPPPA